MQIKQPYSRALSLIEFVLVLVAVGFLILGGIHFIAVQVEQTKIRKAADQIEGWLLAAQSYYRSQVFAGKETLWPTQLSDLYPFIADSTIDSKLNDDNTHNPWGNPYKPQPTTYNYQPVYLDPSDNNTVDPTMFKFFTLQTKVKTIKSALAIASRLPSAQLARDRTTGELLQDSDDYYYLNAMISPPPIVTSQLHHQLVANLGVVKTKTRLDASHNGYNYTLDDPNNYLANFAVATNGTGKYFIKPEYGGYALSHNQAVNYGAVFIKKPICPVGTKAHLQASIAGFGLLGGYMTQYNRWHSEALDPDESNFVPKEVDNSPYFLFSTSPVPQDDEHANSCTASKSCIPSDNKAFPLYEMDMAAATATTPSNEFYMGEKMPLSKARLLGAIIGAHIRQSAEQNYMTEDGSDSGIRGWYLWLDITANMAMYPNYAKNQLPKVIQDCAMNVNTRSSEFPYLNSVYDTGLSHDAYDFIPENPNVVTDAGAQYGQCPTSGSCQMTAADLITRGTSPLYLPSPCHFHSGYIAYITTCVPTEAIEDDVVNGQQQNLEQEYGLNQAETQLQNPKPY